MCKNSTVCQNNWFTSSILRSVNTKGIALKTHPTQLPIQWVPGVKWQVHGAAQSPPSSVQVKNGEAIPSLPIHLQAVLNQISTRTTLPFFYDKFSLKKDLISKDMYMYMYRYVQQYTLVKCEKWAMLFLNCDYNKIIGLVEKILVLISVL